MISPVILQEKKQAESFLYLSNWKYHLSNELAVYVLALELNLVPILSWFVKL